MKKKQEILFDRISSILSDEQKALYRPLFLRLLEILMKYLNSKCQSKEKREEYIRKTFEVAHILISWEIGPDTISAGLLHVLIENSICDLQDIKLEIEPKIFDLINNYMIMRKALNNNTLSREAIVTLYKDAFYIEAASRAYVLKYNLENNSNYDETYSSYVNNTKSFIIPLLREINAFRIAIELEELCFKIDHKDIADIIDSSVDKYDIYNRSYRSKFVGGFKRWLNIRPIGDTFNLPEADSLSVIKFICKKRTINSLYDFITMIVDANDYNTKLQDDLKKINNKYRVAFYDILVVLEDRKESGKTNSNRFLQYYDSVLQEKGIYIYGYFFTKEDNSNYFLISDPMKNMYRLFIKSESEYRQYLFGDIYENISSEYVFQRIDKGTIKVFLKDGEAIIIDKGATVLDLAFYIREDLGIYFLTAFINDNKIGVSAHHTLENGDKVEIIKTKELTPTVKISWFKYVTTEKAVNCLINYFDYHLDKSNEEITILVNTGGYVSLKKGATVLDFAFMVHNDMGLHFDYAEISDDLKKETKKVSCDYILKDHDKVTIYQSVEITASYFWFRHVTTKKAVNRLIEYFKKRDKLLGERLQKLLLI